MAAESTPHSARRRRSRNASRASAGAERRGAPFRAAAPAPARAEEPAEPGDGAAGLKRLSAPRDGVTPVIDRVQTLLEWCERAQVAPGEPVALDAERASSYRYSQKAYLIQMRTAAAGTALVDPTAFTLPSTLARTLAGREWVLHAAPQDLPNLAELGLRPDSLFDTELAGRLLGMPKVSLGSVVEDTLGLSLAKEHSAADWSRRPLPETWLTYAALDVEVLVEVRDVLAQRLRDAGKDAWAREEFAHLRRSDAPEAMTEPWRRLQGLGVLRSPRQLAVARALWQRRDGIAAAQDLSPHRVLRDKQIVAAAKASSQGKGRFLESLPPKLRDKNSWWQAARSGLELGEGHLPERNERVYPPPHKLWQKKHPQVWERYTIIREAVGQRAEELQLPTENLLKPSLLRRWVWEHETPPASEDAVRAQLQALDARPWQAEQTAPVILAAFPEPQS